MRFTIIAFLFLVIPALKNQLGAQDLTIPQFQFTENKGQWTGDENYRVGLPKGTLYMFNNSLGYVFYDSTEYEHYFYREHTHNTGNNDENESHTQRTSFQGGTPTSHEKKSIKGHSFSISFKNATRKPAITPERAQVAKINYLYGSDRSKWAADVSSYQQLNYQEIYKNIDFKMFNTGTGLKYEFHVAPSARPEQITLSYKGTDKLEIKNGHLFIYTSVNTLEELPPYAYQNIHGNHIQVPCKFRITNDSDLSFELGDYDNSYPLIIDPQLVFSTSSGSRADNWGSTACFDNNGNLYTGGSVFSTRAADRGTPDLTGFPTTPGAFSSSYTGGVTDMGLMKYDSAGTQLLYSTYLGGLDTDVPISTIVDQSTGELIVLGATGSLNFPGAVNAFSGGTPVAIGTYHSFNNGTDIIVTRLGPNGNTIVQSRYLGGSGNDGVMSGTRTTGNPLVMNYGDQLRGDIFIDAGAQIYIASVTSSTDFQVSSFSPPYAGGLCDGLVVRLSDNMQSVIWARHLGGSGEDATYSIKNDLSGLVYVTGGTNSADLPVTRGVDSTYNGEIDGYIFKLTGSGDSILAGTYLGTPQYDQSYFLELDKNNNVYVYGQTRGAYPVTAGVYSNPNSGQFIHKLNETLTTTIFSTVIGSDDNAPGTTEPNISPTAFLVNDCEQIYLSGWGGLVNLGNGRIRGFTRNMPIRDAVKATSDGSDFYIMVLGKDAQFLIFGSYFGGDASAEHVDGGTSRFDKKGFMYQSVCANCGGNRDFPTFPDDGSQLTYPKRSESNNCNNGVFKMDLSSLRANVQDSVFCLDSNATLVNTSKGGKSFLWYFGDGDSLATTSNAPVQHNYPSPGPYNVILIAIDSSTCSIRDTARTTVYIRSNISVVNDTSICAGASVQLNVFNSYNPSWAPSTGLSCINCSNPIATPTTTTTYAVLDTIGPGCLVTDTVNIDVTDPPDAAIGINNPQCITERTVTFQNFSSRDQPFLWYFGDGDSLEVNDRQNVTHTYGTQGAFQVRLKSSQISICNKTEIDTVDIFVKDSITVTNDTIVCEGTSVQLSVSNSIDPFWSPGSTLSCDNCTDPIASPPSGIFTYQVIDGPATCQMSETVTIESVPPPDVSIGLTDPGCVNTLLVTFENNSNRDLDFTWDFGDGDQLTTTSREEVTHFYSPPGSYQVRLTGADNTACFASDTDTLDIFIKLPITAFKDTSLCAGQATVLDVDNATIPIWSPATGLNCVVCKSPTANPDSTTTYSVRDTENGCTVSDTVQVVIIPLVYPDPDINIDAPRCFDSPVKFRAKVKQDTCRCCQTVSNLRWVFGDGETSNELNTEHLYFSDGTYDVVFESQTPPRSLYSNQIELFTTDSCLKNIYIPNAFTPNNDGVNDILYVRGINIIKLEFHLFNELGEEVFTTNNLNKGWNGIYKNRKQKPQVFSYLCTATFYDGETFRQEGNVTLVE